MKLSDEVRTWLLTGSDCEFDYYGYGDRIAALEAERDELAAELVAAKRGPLLVQIAELGLQECEFNDECDFCDDPQGLHTYCAISSGEGYTETDFYICEKCIPAHHKKICQDNEELLISELVATSDERNELASELKKHCGCEFDPVTAKCTVTCQTHKRVEDALAAAKAENERIRGGLKAAANTIWEDL